MSAVWGSTEASGQALRAAWILDLQAQASPHLQDGPHVQGWHWQGWQGQGLVMSGFLSGRVGRERTLGAESSGGNVIDIADYAK